METYMAEDLPWLGAAGVPAPPGMRTLKKGLGLAFARPAPQLRLDPVALRFSFNHAGPLVPAFEGKSRMSDDPVLAALARLEAGQISLRVDLMARMDRLADALTLIRDDIAVNMGAAEAMERANDNTRADLRTLGEQVSVMWKQIKRLQTDMREIKRDP